MPRKQIPGSELAGGIKSVGRLRKASWEGQTMAQVDIFRIEDGYIVEYRANSEPVSPEEEWVNSGKF